MFFESLTDVPKIAAKNSVAVFVVPKGAEIEIKNALVLRPEDKTVITIEQVRQVLGLLGTRQLTDVYVVIQPAEALNLQAANALLKTLEEPGEKVHFVLVTDAPSQLLPTILSRAAIYMMRDRQALDSEIKVDEKTKALAKRLLVAKGVDLVEIAEEIAKKKAGPRAFALEVLGAAIEMLYKSYFITGKEVFVAKLPKFLQAYDAVAKNGHIKLQIVSNLC